MESTKSSTKLSSVLASLSETLTNFRGESAEIESKFNKLVDGMAKLGPLTVGAGVSQSALDSNAVEQLEKLDRSIAEQREEFAGKQHQLSDDVGRLRDMFDQQVKLSSQDTQAKDSIAVEQLEKLDRSIAEQREDLSGKQNRLSDDFRRLRDIVDQQVKLISQETPATDSIAVDQLERLDRSITEQREEFTGTQNQLSDDVRRLSDIVDQQVKLISQETPAKDSIAVEQLETLDRAIAEQREDFSGKQTQLSDDVRQLREMVDQQVKLFSQETPAKDSIAVEQLETLDRAIAEQRAEFAGKQNQLSDDVGRLREVVDQQVQLFAAWIKATSQMQRGNAPPRESPMNSAEDDVLTDVFAQFDELRGAPGGVAQLPTT